MSSTRRGTPVRHPEVVDVGCSCRRPKIPSFIYPASSQAKLKAPKSPETVFSPSTTATPTNTTTASLATGATTSTASSPSSEPKGRVVLESVAVVKESSDPYQDFRDSMLVMIVEKEIYAWDDLRDLLHRLLSLNAPRHHHHILQAFADICRAVFSPPSKSSVPGLTGGCERTDRR